MGQTTCTKNYWSDIFISAYENCLLQLQLSHLRISFREEQMELTPAYYRSTIFYDFKERIVKKRFLERLLLTYGNKAPSPATVFRTKNFSSVFMIYRFCRDHVYRKTFVSLAQNLSAIWKMLMGDNHWAYEWYMRNFDPQLYKNYSWKYAYKNVVLVDFPITLKNINITLKK